MSPPLSRATRAMWSSLWLVPLLCLAGGIVLSLGTLAMDRRFDYQLIPHGLTGGPTRAARSPASRCWWHSA